MELTAIYHRPESEYAYLYKEGQLHIRIRTKKNDVQQVILHSPIVKSSATKLFL